MSGVAVHSSGIHHHLGLLYSVQLRGPGFFGPAGGWIVANELILSFVILTGFSGLLGEQSD